MRGRPAVTLVLLFLLPGCLGSEPAPAPPVADAAGEPTVDASTVENATYLQNADYSQAHIHDYWASAETAELMDEAVATSTFTSVFLTAFSPLVDGTVRTGVGAAFFTLPNGSFVPEGAGELLVEVDATAALKQGEIAFAYQAADAATPTAMAPQPAVASWTVELTPAMADLPHAKSTRWLFRLEASGPGAVLDGEMHVRITARRLFDIAAWPQHADFWAGGSLTKLDLGNATGTYEYTSQHLVGADEGAYERFRPAAIVPPETRALVVTLRYERGADPKNSLNGPVLLTVKDGATSRGHQVMHGNVIRDEPGVKVYAVPVDGSTQDSPYADESGWSFQLHAPFGFHDVPPDGDTIDIGGLDLGSGTYDVGVVAYRVVPPWLDEVLKDEICRSC